LYTKKKKVADSARILNITIKMYRCFLYLAENYLSYVEFIAAIF